MSMGQGEFFALKGYSATDDVSRHFCVHNFERNGDLLVLQPCPALPRLRSLRPASKVARLADSLNNLIRDLRTLVHYNPSDGEGAYRCNWI